MTIRKATLRAPKAWRGGALGGPPRSDEDADDVGGDVFITSSFPSVIQVTRRARAGGDVMRMTAAPMR